jgi:hypothetical protein
MPRGRSEDLVVVRTYSYRPEAELALSALEANGIGAMVEADDCGGQRPLLGANIGVKLLVRRPDIDRASELLR